MKVSSRRAMGGSYQSRGRRLGSLVDPMEAVTQAGEHLIADGAERRGQLVDAEIGAEQRGEVAAAGAAVRNVGYVDADQIHGDAPHQGTAFAGNQHLRG